MRPSRRCTAAGTRTKQGEVYGYDGGKKLKGRKRHLIVDSQGLMIGVLVTEANAPERLGAVVVLSEAGDELSETEVIWVDSGYSGKNFARVVQQICATKVEVIQRIAQSFEVLPKRWIVEGCGRKWFRSLKAPLNALLGGSIATAV